LSSPNYIPPDPEGKTWDVVIIGTGMGGATVGHALASKGHEVLFIEKGMFLFGDHDRGDGRTPANPDQSHNGRLRRGWWPLPLAGTTSFGDVSFFAPLGCGTGGSTGVYAAQLERFAPCDFKPRADFPSVSDSSLPDAWPISYEDLAPYYAQAERSLGVRGTQDPLHPDNGAALLKPPPLGPRDQDLFDSFVELGLHPYRSHVGCRNVEGCEGCGGGLCPRDCRTGDAGRTFLLPALAVYGASLLTECEVTRLEASESQVTGVWCNRHGSELCIRGRIVILAAGAYMSPTLLFRSRSEIWPDGLANRSGLVGRNLMLHASDFIAVRPRRQLSDEGQGKSISVNDFYVHGGTKLGTFQTVGFTIDWRHVLYFLRLQAGKDPKWWLQLSKPFFRPLAWAGGRFFSKAKAFATVIEDLPYHHNRVLLDSKASNGMRFEYHYPAELAERTQLFYEKLEDALGRNHDVMRLSGANNINYGHACGTCRFDDDPRRGVLDRDNRAHDLDNLYVVDASFFPSSGGTNPSLTIAANSLRVAKKIDARLGG
jgi:choline dehydrogenase-like flavoprotein